MPRAKSEHYVDNKKLYAEMVTYLEAVKESEESDSKRPRVPEYIGECLLKISTRLSTKPNFINYTYRDEMISDGIENCINYIGNFNPEKSSNPFAYFTQIIYYAFIRRIQKEKKQVTIKHRLIMDNNYDDMTLQPGEDGEFKNQFREFLQKNIKMEEPVKKEKPKAKKKKKKATSTLNFFN